MKRPKMLIGTLMQFVVIVALATALIMERRRSEALAAEVANVKKAVKLAKSSIVLPARPASDFIKAKMKCGLVDPSVRWYP